MEVNRQGPDWPVFIKRVTRMEDGRELIYYDFKPSSSSNQPLPPSPIPKSREGEDHV